MRKHSRVAVMAIVLALHLAVGVSLWRYRQLEARGSSAPEFSSLWLSLHEPQERTAARIPAVLPRAERSYLPAPALTAPGDPEPDPPGSADWDDAGRRSAARIAAEWSQGNPAGPPAPQPKPFHWDVASTRRWQPAPEGGTVVRLNDHCQIVFNPLPIGGCALGKIEPRGDLFEGMKSAREGRSAAP